MDEKKGKSLKDFWNHKKVFITGATGFIGSWLSLRLLELGANITILHYQDKLESPLIEIPESSHFRKVSGDITDELLLKKIFFSESFDVVIHLAAQTQVVDAVSNPLSFFDVNVRGAYYLLEACRLSGQRCDAILIASTDKVYGSQPSFPFTEQSPLLAKYPYESSKVCLEKVALSYFHTYHLPVVITRSANVFGGGDFNWNRLIPSVIKNLHFDEPITLRSSGNNLRDYIFVEDVVQAYLQLGSRVEEKKLAGEIFNISAHEPKTALEIVDTILKLTKKESHEIKILSQNDYEIEHQIVSSEKIKTSIGFEAQFPLQLSLELTIEWYLLYFDQKRKASYALSHHRS